jgi:hypothetical protein
MARALHISSVALRDSSDEVTRAGRGTTQRSTGKRGRERAKGTIELTRGGFEIADDVLGARVSSNSLVTNLLTKGVGTTNTRDHG